MKKNYLFKLSVVILLFSVLVINSCRQELTVYDEANLKREIDFFKNAESKLSKINGGSQILDILKEENEKTHFVSKLSDHKGNPVWDKMIVHNNVIPNKQGESESEKRILIPLTEDVLFMSSYIAIAIDENNHIKGLHNLTNKKLYKFIHDKSISKEIRESVITNVIFANYQTFGFKKFINIPKDLFPEVSIDS